MVLHFTEFLQVKEKGNLMFEKDLYKLSDILGRPAPEFRGAQVDVHDQGNLSWLIESSVRTSSPPIPGRCLSPLWMPAGTTDCVVPCRGCWPDFVRAQGGVSELTFQVLREA